VRLPVPGLLPDGSYRSVLIDSKMNKDTARRPLIEAARRGDDLDPDQARAPPGRRPGLFPLSTSSAS
jgi:hypothetical protein